MNLDATTIGAFLGFFGLVVTTIGGVYIATRTNRSEKEDSAKKAFEQTRDAAYDARILLRDEQIADLRDDLARCKLEFKLRIEELEAELDRAYLSNKALKGAIDGNPA